VLMLIAAAARPDRGGRARFTWQSATSLAANDAPRVAGAARVDTATVILRIGPCGYFAVDAGPEYGLA